MPHRPPLRMRYVPAPAALSEPGEFRWLLENTLYPSPAINRRLEVVCPCGHMAIFPIHPLHTNSGYTWVWDGDLILPTISPVVTCVPDDPRHSCWTGCIRRGFLTDPSTFVYPE